VAHRRYPVEQKENGIAVAGMVCGTVGLVLSFVPCAGMIFGPVLGLLGAIFGGIGLAQSSSSGQGKGMAVAGLATGVLALIWGPLFWWMLLAPHRAATYW
jgi:hypothetical protein